MKTLAEVQALLATCKRDELQDHAFGDCEVGWTDASGADVANGYFNGDEASVSATDGSWSFDGEDAFSLRRIGARGLVERNDSTGPAAYIEGEVMPGLTAQGVLDEITSPDDD